MSSVGGAGDIETLLQRIGETGALPDAYTADPGLLFLAIHDQWVENGGTVAGKIRHSVRNLMDMLDAAGTPVPSLRSKLNGDTRLKLEDAVALLDVYFSRWNITSSDNQDEVRYLSLKVIDSEEAEQIMIQSLFGNRKSTLLPKIQRDRKGISKRPTLEADDSAIFWAGSDLLPESFRSSKAIIHVSRIGSVAGPTTMAAIRRFCEIMDEYWKIDTSDNFDRSLIWIVDPGDRDIYNDESLAALANAERLATFFRSVRLLSDQDAEARWRWLSSHAVVLVGSMDRVIIDRIYAPYSEKFESISTDVDVIRRSVKYSHFLLDVSPPSWLRSPQFTKLYGEDLENLESSAFLLYLDDAETCWRYFGYAPADPPILAKNGKVSFAKYLELDSPGPSFDRVASIVHAAASFRLGMRNPNIGEEERLRSLVILRHLDFAVFKLIEFLNAEKLSSPPP